MTNHETLRVFLMLAVGTGLLMILCAAASLDNPPELPPRVRPARWRALLSALRWPF